jgi:hypothetical protein
MTIIYITILTEAPFHNTSVGMLCLEEFEDTKGVIRIRTSKKNRQHNGQKKKYKRNKIIPLSEAFGHTVKYTGFVGCVVIVWEVLP